MHFRLLRRDEKGVSAVEFALLAPVLITFIIGIAQMGKMFFVNADMRAAVAVGARVASVWPVPEHATIVSAVEGRLVRTGAIDKTTVTVADGEDASGNPFITIGMTYQVPLDFVFFQISGLTLTESRRVYIQRESETTTDGTLSTAPTPSVPPPSVPPVNPPPPNPPPSDPPPADPPADPAVPPPVPPGKDKDKDKHDHGGCKHHC